MYTLPAHMYRNNGEPYTDHQVDQFIKDKLYPDSSNVMTDGDGTIVDFGERCSISGNDLLADHWVIC